MYFETFPQEAIDQLSETGPVYVRHRDGRMVSPPGMGPPEKRPKLERAELDQLRSHTAVVNGSPPKLFNICLDFVAANINMVESLVDFPEVIGHQLFKAVEDSGRLSVPSQAARTLGLFCEAYGDLVMSSLTLRGQVQQLNDYLEFGLQYITALRQLDLSNCGLGDEHSILGEVGQMPSLSHLSLQGNCLSHRGVQRVTMPHKMFGRGPAKLEVINLADNPDIDDKVVGCLVAFKRLRAIDLSLTTCSFTESGIKRLCALGWTQSKNTLPEFSEGHRINNTGWAQEVVEDWLHPTNNKQNACESTMAKGRNEADHHHHLSPMRDTTACHSHRPSADCEAGQGSLSSRKFYRKTLPRKVSDLQNSSQQTAPLGHLQLFRRVTSNDNFQEGFICSSSTKTKFSHNTTQTNKHHGSKENITIEKCEPSRTQTRPLSVLDVHESLKEDDNVTVTVPERDEDNLENWSDEESEDLLQSYLQPGFEPTSELSLFSAMDKW